MDTPDAPEIPERWIDDTQPIAPLTRAEVARFLGVSVATVRRKEGTTLHPTLDARGHHVFERAEVIALAKTLARNVSARTPAGRLAAKVFTMFETGDELPAIVIALEVEPAAVRALYEEWHEDLERGYLRKKVEARIRKRVRSEAQVKREMDAWDKRMRELEVDLRRVWAEDLLGPVRKTSTS